MKASEALLLLVSAMPLASYATSYVPVGVKEHLQAARVIAQVEVIDTVPEMTFPGEALTCGATVTAKVIESFKGTETGRVIRFGSGGMAVGKEYLVALYESARHEKPSIIFEWEGMSSEEAEAMTIACRKRLPELESGWRVTAELMSPGWVPWGYRILPPAKSAGLTFIGRRTQNTIESLSYVGEGLAVSASAPYSEDHPEYGRIVASRFDFPQLYVAWESYRNFLRASFGRQ